MTIIIIINYRCHHEQEQSSFTADVHAKPEYHRFLIGRGGSNIRKVREETGARVVFPNNKDEDQTLIQIIGTKESVDLAKKKLTGLIKDLVSVWIKFEVLVVCNTVATALLKRESHIIGGEIFHSIHQCCVRVQVVKSESSPLSPSPSPSPRVRVKKKFESESRN